MADEREFALHGTAKKVPDSGDSCIVCVRGNPLSFCRAHTAGNGQDAYMKHIHIDPWTLHSVQGNAARTRREPNGCPTTLPNVKKE
eukprot:170700-Amphidinium_carterae.1